MRPGNIHELGLLEFRLSRCRHQAQVKRPRFGKAVLDFIHGADTDAAKHLASGDVNRRGARRWLLLKGRGCLGRLAFHKGPQRRDELPNKTFLRGLDFRLLGVGREPVLDWTGLLLQVEGQRVPVSVVRVLDHEDHVVPKRVMRVAVLDGHVWVDKPLFAVVGGAYKGYVGDENSSGVDFLEDGAGEVWASGDSLAVMVEMNGFSGFRCRGLLHVGCLLQGVDGEPKRITDEVATHFARRVGLPRPEYFHENPDRLRRYRIF